MDTHKLIDADGGSDRIRDRIRNVREGSAYGWATLKSDLMSIFQTAMQATPRDEESFQNAFRLRCTTIELLFPHVPAPGSVPRRHSTKKAQRSPSLKAASRPEVPPIVATVQPVIKWTAFQPFVEYPIDKAFTGIQASPSTSFSLDRRLHLMEKCENSMDQCIQHRRLLVQLSAGFYQVIPRHPMHRKVIETQHAITMAWTDLKKLRKIKRSIQLMARYAPLNVFSSKVLQIQLRTYPSSEMEAVRAILQKCREACPMTIPKKGPLCSVEWGRFFSVGRHGEREAFLQRLNEKPSVSIVPAFRCVLPEYLAAILRDGFECTRDLDPHAGRFFQNPEAAAWHCPGVLESHVPAFLLLVLLQVNDVGLAEEGVNWCNGVSPQHLFPAEGGRFDVLGSNAGYLAQGAGAGAGAGTEEANAFFDMKEDVDILLHSCIRVDLVWKP
eukprot:NODE_344_length_2411_cov_26.003387_g319_i0.p1 GENE.NODE_344_length_2411_cov_26.003387_g319_i0~~NODE_344_length_2411_cov_26.003387_g319_i0.p1  ORF type:complete len:441 (+),score=72.77 NODE_344_length_2411_cov_26.003387_g319_i0:1012-2334(+)